MPRKVGLIGLGAMGLPMGRRLAASDFALVVVPHKNRAPAEELAALGAEIKATPSELAQDCFLVITCVPDVPQVREVLFGEGGLAASQRAGLLYVDMSTTNPSAARAHHEQLALLGIEALDAPVSGGPARAADGSLTIMVGGEAAAVERARPVLELLGKNIIHVGGAGSGQAVKLVNQLMISIIMLANVEALTLGVQAGVPLETLLDVIGTSSGSNYLLQNWLPRMHLSGDPSGGFALDLLLKDLGAALRWGEEMGVPTYTGNLAQQLYMRMAAQGAGKLDYSVVARLYEEATGTKLRLEGTED